ncbi:LCP family protein [Devriesea agamarum]|uniref:LCP family protein n=1 Tax=Devriesea agamarum TaxID=472569 RepID=UPI000ABC81EC|nr:LCP family protein [Devriesea agamarum]
MTEPRPRRPRHESRGRHVAPTRRSAPARQSSTGPQPARHSSTASNTSASHGRRAHCPQEEGSLPRAAGWTVLGWLIPGLGLLPTKLRALGWVLIGLEVLAVLAVSGLILFGDPAQFALAYGTRRSVLLAGFALVIVLGLVWIVQLLLTNRIHNVRQHLRGSRMALSVALALVLVAASLFPIGKSAQYLWAAQHLVSSSKIWQSNTNNSAIGNGADPWKNIPRLNILMLGQDAGADRTGTRPDTIMVASIDTKSGRTALFSIPRNLEHVRFPPGTAAAKRFPNGFRYYGPQQDLINAVWSWAEDQKELFPGDPNPGLTATRWAVEQTLGLKLDYYAMVNLKGFEDLVNAIGGVDIQVERRIPIGGGKDPGATRRHPITGWIEPGWQHLDGYHALWYARSREGSDDFNRICRQQRMIRIVTEEADPLTLAAAFPKLVTATENNIVTDIPPDRLEAFANLALKVKKAGFLSLPLNQSVTPSNKANWSKIRTWANEGIEASLKVPENTSAKGGSSSPTPGSQPSGSPSGSPSKKPSEPTSSSGTGSSATPQIDPDPLQSCMPQ